MDTFGLDDGSKMKFLCEEILKRKFQKTSITFKELYDLTEKTLIVCGANISKREMVYFEYEHYPDMSVIEALCISMCFPLLFTPRIIDGEYYVDSGVYNNLPVCYFSNSDETLGINVIQCHATEIHGFVKYLQLLLQTLMRNNTDVYNNYKICNLEINEKTFFFSLSELSLITDNELFEDYYNQGYLQSLSFFETL
jgi:predicted acylesterase/phospholipase RssA